MKKLVKTLSALMMSAILILPVAIPVQAEGIDNNTKEQVVYSTQSTANGTINANNVNLRKGPSTSSESLGQLNKGDRVYATSTIYDASGRQWRYCEVLSGANKGLKGFVAAQYIS